jgi:hypothetical protein
VFLADFFDRDNEFQWLQYSPGAAIWHMCPYFIADGLYAAGVKKVFVGRLETFHQSMVALGRHAHVVLPTPRTEGHHPVEVDIVARWQKEAMLTYLSGSPEWGAKLAERYRPDICLFRYNTTPCGNMSRYQSIASNIVFIKITNHHH